MCLLTMIWASRSALALNQRKRGNIEFKLKRPSRPIPAGGRPSLEGLGGGNRERGLLATRRRV